MFRYIVRRVVWLALVLLIVALITYLIFFVMPPTDPAVNFCGKQPTVGSIAEVKQAVRPGPALLRPVRACS